MAFSSEELDYLARLVERGQEAGPNYTSEDRRALTHVVLNRLRSGGDFGKGLTNVMEKPGAFEPIGKVGGKASNLPKTSPDRVAEVTGWVDDYMNGRAIDPTGGSLFFQNKKETEKRGTDYAKGLPPSHEVGEDPYKTSFYPHMASTPPAERERLAKSLGPSNPLGGKVEPPMTSTGLGWEYLAQAHDLMQRPGGAPPLPAAYTGGPGGPTNAMMPPPGMAPGMVTDPLLPGGVNIPGTPPVATPQGMNDMGAAADSVAAPGANMASVFKGLGQLAGLMGTTEQPQPMAKPAPWMPQPSAQRGTPVQYQLPDPIAAALAGKLQPR